MKFLDLPTWLYFPFKLILMVSFLVPVLLWGGQMLGVSRAQETALANKELQSTERQAMLTQQHLDQERDVLVAKAEDVSGRVEREVEHMPAIAQQEVLANTKAHPQGPAGHTESAKGVDVSHADRHGRLKAEAVSPW